MNRKFFDGLYVIVPVVLATQIAMSTSAAALQALDVSVTPMNQFISGSIIGTIAGVVGWLALVGIAHMFGRGQG